MIRGRRARSRARTSRRRTRTRPATHPGGVQPRTGRSRPRPRRPLQARARRRPTRRESGCPRASRARRTARRARRTAAGVSSGSARASRAWAATLAALAPRGPAESAVDDELVARAALGAVPALSRTHARRLIALYGSARALGGAGAARLAAQLPRRLATTVARALDARAGERALELGAACGIRAV